MRVLHFCWLIDAWNPSREKYLQAWVDAGWPCVLWHGGQLDRAPVEGVELRNAETVIAGSAIESCFRYEARHGNHATCADLFRYEVLLQHGGVYCDIDILPGADASVSLLDNQSVPRFCAVFEDAWCRPEIRFLVSSPVHRQLIERLRDTAVANTRFFIESGGYAKNGVDNILHRTGPKMAEALIYDYAREEKISSREFLIFRAVVDSTNENCAEHWIQKIPRIKDVAALT